MAMCDSESDMSDIDIKQTKRAEIMASLQELFAATKETNVRLRNPVRFPPPVGAGVSGGGGGLPRDPVYDEEVADGQVLADLEAWDERQSRRRYVFVCSAPFMSCCMCASFLADIPPWCVRKLVNKKGHL